MNARDGMGHFGEGLERLIAVTERSAGTTIFSSFCLDHGDFMGAASPFTDKARAGRQVVADSRSPRLG